MKDSKTAATKTYDMTDRGNYDLSPFGECNSRHSDEGLWRVSFRGAEGGVVLGTFDSKAKAKAYISRRIEGARQYAKERELKDQQEAEARVAAARQQLPKQFRGLNLAEYPGARNFIGADDRTLLFGDMDAANLQAACAIFIEAAREGHSTRFMAVNDVLASRVSEIAAPDLLLIDWRGDESKEDAPTIAKVLDALLRARESKPTMIISDIPHVRLKALIEDAKNERIADEAETERRKVLAAAVAAAMQGPPPPTRYR